MSLAALINRPCTIISRDESGTSDDYGNETSDETSTATVCELQQQRRTEEGDQGETSDTLWLLILPAGTAIRTGDVIVVDGATYEMVGDPWPARNPRTQQASHVEATVRRTVGSEDAS